MMFRVTFHLDGGGLYYDPNEPIHLDALLAWALAPMQGQTGLQRDQIPRTVELPLMRQRIGAHWVWRASALLPDGPQAETLQFWRKRFRERRAELAAGSPNLTNGTYRDWNVPIPIMLTRRLVAYASGNRKACKRALRQVRHLGKKRGYGLGKIVGMDFDEVAEDWSLTRDGMAMRWMPDPAGTRLVRLRPPYWHPHERVRCCDVGDAWATPGTAGAAAQEGRGDG